MLFSAWVSCLSDYVFNTSYFSTLKYSFISHIWVEIMLKGIFHAGKIFHAMPFSTNKHSVPIKCTEIHLTTNAHDEIFYVQKKYHFVTNTQLHKGRFHGTQHLVFRLSHFNAAIFRADNFSNCLNSSCASLSEKKNVISCVVSALISTNLHFGGSGKKMICP